MEPPPSGADQDLPSLPARRQIESYEEWIASIIRQRRPALRKQWYESNLAAAVASVLTVLATAYLGYYFGVATQSHERAIAERAAILQEERELINDVQSLIARMLKATDDRLKIARGEWKGIERDTAIILPFIRASNAADAEWLERKELLGMHLRMHFLEVPGVVSTWDSTKTTVQEYADCVLAAYRTAGYDTPTRCAREQDAANKWNVAFRDALVSQYRADLKRGLAELIDRPGAQ